MQLFETTRLIIRKFTPDDGEELREYAVYKQQTDFEAFNEWPTDLEGCQGLASYFAGIDNFWAVCRKTDKKCIGFLAWNGIDSEKHLDLGHGFIPRYNIEHMDQEAIEGMVQYVFDTMDIVAIDARNENEWVEQVAPLRRIGFAELEDRMQMTRWDWKQQKILCKGKYLD